MRLGHYRLDEEIGRGGMGTVWRAWDESLQRTVALKVLHSEADEDLRRFLREARTMAALDHPNIVPVYEVGEADARPYIAMELVPGGTLRAFVGRADRRPEFLRLMTQVCRAVQHAHSQGIVHRDLKPGNILIKAVPRDGRPTPVAMVADFGLARRFDSRSHLTQSGASIGTPEYMSPEQCEGTGELDGRSDVFSLGALLYEALTGRRPFAGDTPVSILMSVMSRDPESPRRIAPDLAPDLETIVLKALEKDPARRYAGAGALGEDLQRHLEGEPILARPISTTARILRVAVRHKGAGLAALAAALLLGTSATLAFVSDRRTHAAFTAALQAGRDHRAHDLPAPARDAFSQALAWDESDAEARAGFAWADAEVRRRDLREAEERRMALAVESGAKETLRKAGLVQQVLTRWILLAEPLRELEATFHDTRSGAEDRRERGDRVWPRVEPFIAQTPGDSTSQSVMKAFAGWARRLAGREEEAGEWMRQACALDADLPYGPLLLALVDLSEYLTALPLPSSIGGALGLEFGPMPGETPRMKELRASIEARLTLAAAAPVWGEGLAQDFRTVVDAMRALQAGSRPEAEERLTKAAAAAGLQVFQPEVLFARAKVRYLLKRFADGLADLDRVGGVRPESAELFFYKGTLRTGQAEEQVTNGSDPRDWYDAAIADFDRALARNPRHAPSLNSRGCCLLRKGEAEEERGVDPERSFVDALAAFEATLAIDPGFTEAGSNRGLACLNLAGRAASNREWARKAVAAFDEALKIDPEAADAYDNRALACERAAELAPAGGEDPQPWLDQALAGFEEALRRDPANVQTLRNRGGIRLRRAQVLQSRGADPRPELARALADFDEALRLRPDFAEAAIARGNARWFSADREAAAGRDAGAQYDAAIADYDAAILQRPGYVGGYHNRAGAFLRKGEAEAARGADPGAAWERAFADYDRILKIAPWDATAYKNRGALRVKTAERRMGRGEDARSDLRAAIADLDEAVSHGPKDPDAWFNRAGAWWSLGEAEIALGADPRASLNRAIEDYDRTLILYPVHGSVFAHRGSAHLSRAEAALSLGGDARPSAESALADLTEALKRAPDDAAAHETRANAWRTLGEIDAAQNRDPQPSWDRAFADYSAALRLQPKFWPTYANRGTLLERMGRVEDAVKDYETAQSLAPGDPQVEALLKDGRARLREKH